MHIESALTEAWAQFVSFQTEVSIDDNDPTRDAIRDYAPELFGSYLQARQQTEPFGMDRLNSLHVPAAALSIAAIALALLLSRPLGLPPAASALCLSVLLALVINAVICGVFSHPVDRYQSRLVPLAAFAFAVVVFTGVRRPLMKSK